MGRRVLFKVALGGLATLAVLGTLLLIANPALMVGAAMALAGLTAAAIPA